MYRLNKGLVILSGVIFVAVTGRLSYANDDFSRWKQQYQESFQEYKDKRDKEFTAFLKMQWKEMDLLKGKELDTTPKPKVMPVAKPLPVKQPQPIPTPEPVVKDEPEPQKVPELKPDPVVKIPETPKPVVETPTLPESKPEPVVLQPVVEPEPDIKPVVPPEPRVVHKGRKIVISYMGGRHTFYYDPKLKASFHSRVNEKAVSRFWSDLSKADYDDLINQINEKSDALKLNDWAYALLVNEISKNIYSTESSQSLFSWFILAKAGYQSRIAYNDKKVFLLVPSKQPLYAVPYFTFDKVRYYAVRFDGKDQKLGQVYTYDGNYPDAIKALNMQMNTEAQVASKVMRRDLSFDFEGKRYQIRAAYNNDRIRFMETYPQLDLEWYFKGKVSAVASTSLQRQLSNHMKGMDEQKAVNFLLRFVQTSLRYKTDEVQFGKENYLFPEETLYYPYSDCEDRSILFAWLVHSLLGMDVVGLDYPGHVATAVRFKGRIAGDAIMHNGQRYVVADPTYINASVGMTMPDFKKEKPEVIKIY
ncbi:MAG: hypothetical protein OQK32_07055 [Gammaproteobacteria bacterium]|nr:hypothetical protein [Gammaproteobacteria bacterium]MCW8924487.1 hypothetical protein [Gammaproteobacteria bacterium]